MIHPSLADGPRVPAVITPFVRGVLEVVRDLCLCWLSTCRQQTPLTHAIGAASKERRAAEALFGWFAFRMETRNNIKKLGRGACQVHDGAQHLSCNIERFPGIVLVEGSIQISGQIRILFRICIHNSQAKIIISVLSAVLLQFVQRGEFPACCYNVRQSRSRLLLPSTSPTMVVRVNIHPSDPC